MSSTEKIARQANSDPKNLFIATLGVGAVGALG